MDDLWQYLNAHSTEVWGIAMFVVGLVSPVAARRIRRMVGGKK